MWTDFLTVLVVVMAVLIWELWRRVRMLAVKNVYSIPASILNTGEADELRRQLAIKTGELENVRSQSEALWKENVRLREVQLITADRGMMTMVEEWIEQRDEQNRQTMAALGYQSMHKNDLDNPFGIGPISPYMTGGGLPKNLPDVPGSDDKAERSGAKSACTCLYGEKGMISNWRCPVHFPPKEAERSGAEPLLLEARDVQADYLELLSGGESGAEPEQKLPDCICPKGWKKHWWHVPSCPWFTGAMQAKGH